MLENTVKKLKARARDIYAAPVTIAFLGDSVTQGCFELCNISPTQFKTVFDSEHSFASCMRQALSLLYPTIPVNIINAGVSGDYAETGLKRLDKTALNFHPDLVVVGFALNDCTRTEENAPYNTTDFYDVMNEKFGELSDTEKFILKSEQKPNELYWGAFHYVVNGIDFIGINIDPNTAYNSHEGYYSDTTLKWVKNKIQEIDPLGKKPVFVVGHLSAIYYYNDGLLKETMINGNTELFYDVFKGHKNAFYLYGHVHGERACYRDNTSGAILHINEDNKPIGDNLNESNSNDKEFAYTFVHMGGLRPFAAKYFNSDGLVGFGGLPEKQYYIPTDTPKLSQYLVFEVYEDRVVFHMRNTGDMEGYSQQDKLKEYVVYFRD